jgi:hypothetical protein
VPSCSRFCEWQRNVAIEVIEESDERFLAKTFDDGSGERQPIGRSRVRSARGALTWSRKKEWSEAGSLGRATIDCMKFVLIAAMLLVVMIASAVNRINQVMTEVESM